MHIYYQEIVISTTQANHYTVSLRDMCIDLKVVARMCFRLRPGVKYFKSEMLHTSPTF